ncbi:MAG: MCE family protein [Deltaproteobacteria bacterium]|nr:MCE family protein [Deltaproteobacteria bacterium]
MTPVRVGAVVVAAVAAFVFFYVRVNKNKYSKDQTYVVSALFDDASGLAGKTRVQVAGIDVGRIDNIALEGNLARVFLRVRNDVSLFKDARIAKVSESLLGDFKLDITPGSPAAGKLEPGETVDNVQSRSDLNAIQGELRVVAGNVREITEALKHSLAGQPGQPAPMDAIVAQVQEATAAVNQIAQSISRTVDANDQNVNAILQNVADLSKKLNTIADNINGVIGANEGDMKKTVSTLREAVDKMKESLDNVASVTKKIDKGEGTLGALVNERQLHDTIAETVEDAAGLVKTVTGLQVEVDLRSEYFFPIRPDPREVLIDPSGYLKNFIQLKLKPKPDKWYQIELISDPRGKQTRTVTTSLRNPGDQLESAQRVDDTTTVQVNSLKFSLMFAKRYYFATFRFGIIEDTGGAGFNLNFFDDRLEIRADIFQFGTRDRFGNPLLPRLKAFALFEPIKHIYLHAGVDDVLNLPYFAVTAGLGIRFTDEDLKVMLGALGSALGGR